MRRSDRNCPPQLGGAPVQQWRVLYTHFLKQSEASPKIDSLTWVNARG
jgi:hypothetical protein